MNKNNRLLALEKKHSPPSDVRVYFFLDEDELTRIRAELSPGDTLIVVRYVDAWRAETPSRLGEDAL